MRDKLIIPIILDDIKLSPAMEYYLASNHYLQYAQNDDFNNQLVNRISSLLRISATTIQSDNFEAPAECEESLKKLKPVMQMRSVKQNEGIIMVVMA